MIAKARLPIPNPTLRERPPSAAAKSVVSDSLTPTSTAEARRHHLRRQPVADRGRGSVRLGHGQRRRDPDREHQDDLPNRAAGSTATASERWLEDAAWFAPGVTHVNDHGVDHLDRLLTLAPGRNLLDNVCRYL
jgi:hypothetical protein